MNMNGLGLVLIFGIINLCLKVVLLNEDGFECVKRKSGACKVFNITNDFDEYIPVHRDEKEIIKAMKESPDFFVYSNNIIFEIDYIENKYSYEQNKSEQRKELDLEENPVVEILFSEEERPGILSYRLVLGEKLNRLAFLEIRKYSKTHIEYNNYSPDLPPWPFAFNVNISVSFTPHDSIIGLNVNQIGNDEPFIGYFGGLTDIKYISMRSRNKGTNLVGFYECSTEYGSYCGIERTQRITDCRQKISPLGSGLYREFIDMSHFNRYHDNARPPVVFSEIFGIYRSEDNMHILFTSFEFEQETYIRLTVGDEIRLRIRTSTETDGKYWEKSVYKKNWNEQPTQPHFIRVSINSEMDTISVWSLNSTSDEGVPIISAKLCNYFDQNDINFMGVTSDHFKTVTLFYDCCDEKDPENCHINTKERERDSLFTITGNFDDDHDEDEDDKSNQESFELKPGVNLTKKYLDTRKFHESDVPKYEYFNDGESESDWCPEQVKNEDLKKSTDMSNTYIHWEIDNSDVLRSLIG